MSRFIGAGNKKSLRHTKTMAYEFAMALALIGGLLIYLLRGKIGLLFGSSARGERRGHSGHADLSCLGPV